MDGELDVRIPVDGGDEPREARELEGAVGGVADDRVGDPAAAAVARARRGGGARTRASAVTAASASSVAWWASFEAEGVIDGRAAGAATRSRARAVVVAVQASELDQLVAAVDGVVEDELGPADAQVRRRVRRVEPVEIEELFVRVRRSDRAAGSHTSSGVLLPRVGLVRGRVGDLAERPRAGKAGFPHSSGPAPRVTTGTPGGKMRLTPMSSSGSGVPAVVGRQDELADLDRFLAAADGLPAALVLEGEAGIGKTTLWQSAVAAASGAYRVLSAQPVAAEAELSHASLADLLEPCVADVLPALPRPQRRALEGALLLAEPEDEPPQPRAVAAGFLGVLRALAREQPVLVALDDVHWLDTSSRAVLEFAFRRLRGEAVAILVSVRVDAEGRSLALGSTFEPERLTRVRLGGLDAQCRGGAPARSARAGADPADAAPGGRRVRREPVLRARARAGARPPARARGPGEPLPVPATLKELVARRLALLPAATLDALRVAALAGDCDVGLLARALGTDPWELIRPAIEAEVIEVVGDRLRFTHPLLASVSRAGTDVAQRREAHRRLAAAVTDPEQRARHLALAADGPDPAVADALDHAAADASRRARRPLPRSSPGSRRSSHRPTRPTPRRSADRRRGVPPARRRARRDPRAA